MNLFLLPFSLKRAAKIRTFFYPPNFFEFFLKYFLFLLKSNMNPAVFQPVELPYTGAYALFTYENFPDWKSWTIFVRFLT